MIDDQSGELVAFEASSSERESVGSEAAIARLADAIVRYARDPALRLRQGRAGRERVLLDFDARAHASRIEREILFAAGLPERQRPAADGR